jgi:hypothetical protein
MANPADWKKLYQTELHDLRALQIEHLEAADFCQYRLEAAMRKRRTAEILTSHTFIADGATGVGADAIPVGSEPPTRAEVSAAAMKDRQSAVALISAWFADSLRERLALIEDGPLLVWSASVAYAPSQARYVVSFRVTHVPLGVDSRPHVALCASLWSETVVQYGFVLTDSGYDEFQLASVGNVDNATFAALFKKAVKDGQGG